MPPSHKQCESCATTLVPTPPMKDGKVIGCPKCGRQSSKTIEVGRFWCSPCNIVYEGLEFGGMCDTRPEENAQKKEEYEQRQAARRRAQQRPTRY